MSISTKPEKRDDYDALQAELELRYGPAVAQEIVDQMRKSEGPGAFQPDYMPVKAASEAVEVFRTEVRVALKKARKRTNGRKTFDKKVVCIETERLTQEILRLFRLYCMAQRGYYRLYRRTMAAYIEAAPYEKYKKNRQKPEVSQAA